MNRTNKNTYQHAKSREANPSSLRFFGGSHASAASPPFLGGVPSPRPGRLFARRAKAKTKNDEEVSRANHLKGKCCVPSLTPWLWLASQGSLGGSGPWAKLLGQDSQRPFFWTIVLCKNRIRFLLGHGVLERRIPGKNGDVSLECPVSPQLLQNSCLKCQQSQQNLPVTYNLTEGPVKTTFRQRPLGGFELNGYF